MSDTFKIKVDEKECEITIKETDKGIKMETNGAGCKKLLKKEIFGE